MAKAKRKDLQLYLGCGKSQKTIILDLTVKVSQINSNSKFLFNSRTVDTINELNPEGLALSGRKGRHGYCHHQMQ